MKVLITPRGFANYGTDIVKEMEAKGVTVHYNDTGKQYTPEQFLELAKDADGIIVGVDVMDKAMMEQCPNLKVVCKFGVGTDNIDLEYAKERGIYVGRTVGSNSKSVAEHVIAMMFMESKNLYTTVRDVKNGGWNKTDRKRAQWKDSWISSALDRLENIWQSSQTDLACMYLLMMYSRSLMKLLHSIM